MRKTQKSKKVECKHPKGPCEACARGETCTASQHVLRLVDQAKRAVEKSAETASRICAVRLD